MVNEEIKMSKIKQTIQKINQYLAAKPNLKLLIEYTYVMIMVIASALTYAIAFRLFISPSVLAQGQFVFVAGGVSGLSQNTVKLLVDIIGFTAFSPEVLQSIIYFLFNIPVFVLGWLKIGKRFTIFSIINVALASVFISVIPRGWESAVIYDSQLTRTLFAGILAGFSAAIAFKANVSSGGMDIVAYYYANRKSEGVGKYTVSFNIIVVVIYFVLNLIKPSASIDPASGYSNVNVAITSLISSIAYLVMSAFVIDFINVRNKKSQVQIITNNSELATILITNFPHGATTVSGKGVYSNNDKIIIYMTASANEVQNVVKLTQEVDANAFINVTDLRQVFGKFYIKPIK